MATVPGAAADVSNSELCPTAVDRQFGAGRESRVEREEEDGLGDFLRRSPSASWEPCPSSAPCI